MKPLYNLLTISAICSLFVSCNKSEVPDITINNNCKEEAESSEEEYYFYSKYGTFTEGEYTEWMAFPELQKFTDEFDHSTHWIYLSEGRNYKGLAQYRYAVRKKPADAERYWIRGGRNSEDFKTLGIQYVRDGYEMISLQLFKDSSGITRHQAVWFKYREKADKDKAPLDSDH